VWVSPLAEASAQSRGEGWRHFDWSRGDVAVIDVESGEARRVGTDVIPFGMAASPDGRHIAAMRVREQPGERHLNVWLFDLHLFAVDGSGGCVLAERVPQAFGCDFSWSPAGAALAYVVLGEEPGQPGRVAVASVDGREVATYGGGGWTWAMRRGSRRRSGPPTGRHCMPTGTERHMRSRKHPARCGI
jgi:hypothetical protein